MNIPAGFLSEFWAIICHLLWWPCLLLAIFKAPDKIFHKQDYLLFYVAACICVLFLWQLKASLPSGLSLHLLGTTLMVLIFGWQLALTGLTLVMIILTLLGDSAWLNFGYTALITILIPAMFSHYWCQLIQCFFKPHLFIFFFINGFFNAALAVAIVGGASTILLHFLTIFENNILLGQYFSAYLLLLFPEAFLTGTLLTLFTVFAPEWVSSYNQEKYLSYR